MIQFLASDLRPVIVEARAHACRIVLVKDQGVYMMSEKSDAPGSGSPRTIAYAVGCNPETTPFDEWWDRARDEFGGDDFAEYFGHDDAIFDRVVADGCNLEITADASHLYVDSVKPDA
ncbi:DUF3085 domain-containing protein [Burkholderia multivorans]|uniref:DUF3085 domain-containing protein n=1 Tax=Burkholderia multivorans TaxID=87883 RepID=A0AAP2MRG6_9BURK|nr:DUF3085 domain-containing protein [Burkholderia multivorans]MBU9360256.1 DUF3085 domain-containing protein [Burkholderia multivorans]MBU9370053.1 DUF3085 domain-containing protein [Burkholderia multivorans]